MKNHPLLSIIIPVYKTEKYLRKCLNSVLEQSYKNIEVIVVNDCTPDDSETIILDYAERDKRIKYVKNKKNLGLFRTRINGFKHSRGQYIATLDSDDSVGIDYYRLLMKDALKKRADITVSSAVLAVVKDESQLNDNPTLRCRTMGDFGMRDIDLKGRDILNAFLDTECYTSHWWIGCCKIYSRKVWKKALPVLESIKTNQVMLEDLMFGVIFMSLAERYVSCESETYFYLKHPDSSSMDNGDFLKFEKNIMDIAYAIDFLENYLKSLNVSEEKLIKFLNCRKIMRRTWGSMISESKFSQAEKERLYYLLKSVSEEEQSNEPTVEDRYCYLLDTPFDSRYNDIKEDICKEKYKYISFDIFDTLLVRPFLMPSDLFVLLNHTYNELLEQQDFVDFAKIRVNAECYARQNLRTIYPQFEEITLDEIYRTIHERYVIPEDICCILKGREIELEKKYCKARSKIKELYEFALACGKEIICISDMYLPQDVVANILSENGYDINKIYLSSKYRVTKSTGNLYKKVVRDLNVMPDEILHIGDNWVSDTEIARKQGLYAWFVPKTAELLENRVPDIEKKKLRGRFYSFLNQNQQGNYINFSCAFQHVGIRSMLAVVSNKYFDNPFRSYSPRTDFNRDPYYMGYFALGMHDFGVAMWLKEQVIQNKNRCVHFVARDGYVVKQIYDVLREKESQMPLSDYFYMSRKSLLPLAVTSASSFYSLDRYMKLVGCTLVVLLELLDPVLKDIENWEEYFFEKGFFIEETITEQSLGKVLEIFSKELFDAEKTKSYRESMRVYFSDIIKPGDAMFDIGYSGRAQAILSNLLGYHIDAYYIHAIDDAVSLYKLEGDFSVKTFFDYTPSTIGRMRELIQSEPTGSCIGYKNEDDRIVPVFEENKLTYPAKMVINLMHKGAVDFAKDLLETFGDDLQYLEWRYIDSACIHEMFLSNPTQGDMSVFRIFYFEDDMFFGKDYVKKDLATLWREDLIRKNLIFNRPIVENKNGMTIADNRIVEKVIEKQIPKSSIPITSDKVDLIHISNKQLGGFYFLFDRRKYDKWLEKECTGIKRFLIYKPYRCMKKLNDGIKQKGILYVATSSYNALCCILHKQKYHANKKCILLLSDWRTNLAEAIRASGFFKAVVIMPDIELRELTKVQNKEFLLLSEVDKEAKAQEFLDVYATKIPVDVFSFKKIILCNDTMPIGSYLCENKTKYEFIEDGNGLYSDNTLMRENVEKLTPVLERYLIDKHHILQHSDYVKKYYINYNAQKSSHFPHNVYNFCVSDILRQIDGTMRERILSIYGGRVQADGTGDSNCVLILTYPLAQRLGMTFEDQYQIYALLMDIYARNKKIHIKPHPDDKGDYSRFKNVRVIPKTILAELTEYATATHYDIALTAVSTSMGGLTNYEKGIVLSREFVEKKTKLFLYYAVALMLKGMLSNMNTYSIEYENEFLEYLFKQLLDYDLYGEIGILFKTEKSAQFQINISESEKRMFLKISSFSGKDISSKVYIIKTVGRVEVKYEVEVEADCEIEINKVIVNCINSEVNLSIIQSVSKR